MKYQTGGTRWPSGNILVQTNCLDITIALNTFWKYNVANVPVLPFIPFRSRPPYCRYRASGERFSSPSRQTVFGEFQAKNLASGSNDLQEIFRKWSIKLGGLGGRVVTYLCKQTVWTSVTITMSWKTSCKDVATRVGRFALHIIFCLGATAPSSP